MDSFPNEAAARFAELNSKQQREGLTDEELKTLDSLRRGYERVMVVRAEAAALLKERGHDVSMLIHRRRGCVTAQSGSAGVCSKEVGCGGVASAR